MFIKSKFIMKKFIFAIVASISLTCFSFSFQSCNEEAMNVILGLLNDSSYNSILDNFLHKDTTNKGNIWDAITGKGDSTNAKGDFLAGIIENIISRTTEDSTEYVPGIWAYSSQDGKEIDTIWLYRDSTMLEHYISLDDTLDVQYSGGYIYYASFEQMIVQVNSVYNYYTKRSIDYNEFHIYGAKKPFFMEMLGMKTLILDDLDTQTGEIISSISYNYVSDVEN